MNLRDFYLAALKAEAGRETAWAYQVFATTQEVEDAHIKDPFPYRVVKTPEQVYYLDPNDTTKLVPIDGLKGYGPLVAPFESITITPQDVANVFKPSITTTYQNVFVNYVMILYALGPKIEFLTGRLSANKIQKSMINRIVDDPKPGLPAEGNDISVSEFYNFADGCSHLMQLTQLSVPGHTEKSMSTHPDMRKVTEALYEKHKDELDNPLVVATIERAQKALDKEWLKDDPVMGLLIKEGKDFDVVRRKMFWHMGHEQGFSTDPNKSDPIKAALREGWDVNKFDAFVNSSRAGTYGRGISTALGGEWVTWLIRISTNAAIREDDCKTTLGDRVLITEHNHDTFEGYYYLNREGVAIPYNHANSTQYVGKRMIIRSPQFCQSPGMTYCKKCMGDKLSEHPEALSTVISELGNRILNMFMSLMHGRSLSTTKFDILEELT